MLISSYSNNGRNAISSFSRVFFFPFQYALCILLGGTFDFSQVLCPFNFLIIVGSKSITGYNKHIRNPKPVTHFSRIEPMYLGMYRTSAIKSSCGHIFFPALLRRGRGVEGGLLSLSHASSSSATYSFSYTYCIKS